MATTSQPTVHSTPIFSACESCILQVVHFHRDIKVMESSGRVFAKNTLARPGLNNGDVVALRVKGCFLSAVEIQSDGSSSDDVRTDRLFTLVPDGRASVEDEAVLLEVVRDGEWIGFKSWVANNKMLQAKRKGNHRLGFYSTRFGIYEQWGSTDLDALDTIHWASTVLFLRNRKVTSCEMKVQVHRVGVVHPVTKHTCSIEGLLEVEERRSKSAVGKQSTQSIQTMSGMMVQEWIKFVEKEKERRSVLEAKVERATEDVEGLKAWAAEQVQCARQDVQEEIELLLQALNDRNEALADAHARLTTRIRWGAALLEAKKAASLGRRMILAWKAITARSKYCKAAVLKLQRRNQVRTALRALDAWSERVQMKNELQRKLRVGVRRLSFLKMQTVFNEWRRVSHDSHEEARMHAKLNLDATMIADAQRVKRCLKSWRRRTSRSIEARRLLSFAANRYEENLNASIFAAWRNRVIAVNLSVNRLEQRVELRNKVDILSKSLSAWRLAVDDGTAEKIEYERSVAWHVVKTQKKVLAAWQDRVFEVSRIVTALESLHASKLNRLRLECFDYWRDMASCNAERRDKLVEFVQTRSIKSMKKAIWFWREHSRYERRNKSYIDHAEKRRNALLIFDCLSWWRALSHEEKLHRKFVKICTLRRENKQVKDVFHSWRKSSQKTTKSFMNLINYTDVWSKRRMQVAFKALREHAQQQLHETALHAKAVNWYSGRLCARAIWAMEVRVQAHRNFVSRLEQIQFQNCMALKRSVWNSWLFEVDATTGQNANCNNFMVRKRWYEMKQAFSAWRGITAEDIHLAKVESKSKSLLQSTRARWIFNVWRDTTTSQITERLQERKSDSWHSYKISLRMLRAWQWHTANMAEAYSLSESLHHQKWQRTKEEAFHTWNYTARYNTHLIITAERIMGTYALRLQSSAFKAWRERTVAARLEAKMLQRAIIKVSQIRSRQAFESWRQVVEDAAGQNMYLSRMDLIFMKKNRRATLKRVFGSWRHRCEEIRDSVSSMERRRNERIKMMLSVSFCCWRGQVAQALPQRSKALETMAQRNQSRLLVKAFISWRHEAGRQSRNSIVVLHAIDRMSFKLTKDAMFAWRVAAVNRRQRRAMMVHLMQQAFTRKLAEAFKSWRNHVSDEIRNRKNLERCILQKRVAYDLFQATYWESVDEELKDTLGAMFQDAEDETYLKMDSNEIQSCGTTHLSHSGVTSESIQTPHSDLDLEAIAQSFEAKRKELSLKIRGALEQTVSPGRAVTPPKRELNVLEPLQHLFSRRTFSQVSSAAESLSISDFTGSDISDEAGTEILDIEGFSSSEEQESPFKLSLQKKLGQGLRAQSAKGHYTSDPESPLILACEDAPQLDLV